MIHRDGENTREFVKLLFEAVNRKQYVEHAINMIEDEEEMAKIIEFLKSNSGESISWQDIEYEIIKNKKTRRE